LHPLASLALFLPLLDLARVALVRMRRGIAPWIGDRRHLAHRMLDRGSSPAQSVIALCTIAAPIVAAGAIARANGSGPASVAVGASISLALFLAALRVFPARG